MQDVINVLMGAWLFIAPWVLEYTSGVGALNSHIAGLAVLVIAAWALSDLKSWEEMSNMLIGLWLIASPWVLHFYDHWASVLNTTAVGAVVTGLAGYLLIRHRPEHPDPMAKT